MTNSEFLAFLIEDTMSENPRAVTVIEICENVKRLTEDFSDDEFYALISTVMYDRFEWLFCSNLSVKIREYVESIKPNTN